MSWETQQYPSICTRRIQIINFDEKFSKNDNVLGFRFSKRTNHYDNKWTPKLMGDSTKQWKTELGIRNWKIEIKYYWKNNWIEWKIGEIWEDDAYDRERGFRTQKQKSSFEERRIFAMSQFRFCWTKWLLISMMMVAKINKN
jgi:hypothetical protein